MKQTEEVETRWHYISARKEIEIYMEAHFGSMYIVLDEKDLKELYDKLKEIFE